MEHHAIAAGSIFETSLAPVNSCLIGTAEKLDTIQLGIAMTQIPESWRQANNYLLSDDNCTRLRLSNEPYVKLIVCGAKGVGKSTCLRYTVNRLLRKFPKVAIIDCDPGQPEFTGT